MRTKRLPKNKIKWTPYATPLIAMLASSDPPDPSARKPLLWLYRVTSELKQNSDLEAELFLVNFTDEPLRKVEAATGRSTSIDSDELGKPVSVNDGGRYCYNNVLPGEAVKVDEFIQRYDCDFHIYTTLIVESEHLGRLLMSSPMEKGGVRHCVLLWDDLQPGRHVGIQKLTD